MLLSDILQMKILTNDKKQSKFAAIDLSDVVLMLMLMLMFLPVFLFFLVLGSFSFS